MRAAVLELLAARAAGVYGETGSCLDRRPVRWPCCNVFEYRCQFQQASSAQRLAARCSVFAWLCVLRPGVTHVSSVSAGLEKGHTRSCRRERKVGLNFSLVACSTRATRSDGLYVGDAVRCVRLLRLRSCALTTAVRDWLERLTGPREIKSFYFWTAVNVFALAQCRAPPVGTSVT